MVASPSDSTDVPAALVGLSGTILEQRYELGRVLGSGGMGAVFEARHLRLDRPVAIKVLRPAYAGEVEYIQRFLREAKAASKIRHRNVVEILDYGETADGLVYSVMEFLMGQDLEQLLRAQPQGRLPWARACGLLVQIASGLKAAHGQGVIHRDIKPANCFLTDEDGEPVVKLLDFGIAKLDGGDRGHTLTGTAQVLGTPSYIAPELVRTGQPAGPRSDIYALGVVAYRMLTGRVPFAAETVFELLRKACFDPVPSLRAQVPELPRAVEALVVEMLDKEPQRRPADVLAVRQRLVALSWETLGAQAVVIPGSSALPLGVEGGVLPRVSTEDTTVPREVAERPQVATMRPQAAIERPQVAEVGFTEVVPKPLPEGFERGPVRPPGAPPAVVVATTVAGVPQGAVHDPTSSPSPSRSGATVPSVGEATLQSLEASGSIERPRGRGGLWLALGGMGALALAGVFVVPAMLGGEGETGEPAEVEVTVSKVEPGLVESGSVEPGLVEPERSANEQSGHEGGEPLAGAGSAGAETSGAAAMASGGSEAVDDGELVLLEDSEEEHVEPSPESPEPEPAAASRRTRAKAADKASKTSTGPPTDSVLVKTLKRRIRSKCSKVPAGGAVTVKFVVTTSGGLMGLTASPTGSVGQCARAQVQGTKFRPRSKSTPLKITVE